jgi:CheY-like chemotaxis protein
MQPIATKPIEVLLVEDSEADAVLMMKTLEKQKLAVTLHWVQDGDEAIQFLEKQPPFQDRATPDMVFLDLNLPRVTGDEVLRFIRAHPTLSTLPVVVLSASNAEYDIVRTYNLHANAYVTKPVDFAEFRRAVQSLSEFWFTVVRMPPRD